MSAIPAAAPSVVSQRFYEPQRSHVYTLVAKATEMVNDVVALVTDYAIQIDLFGSAEWKCYFNQDVGEEPTLPDDFWKFWHGLDPADRTKKVWETHLPPVLRPEFVIDLDTKARRDFCLTVMGELIQKPKEGHASKYYNSDSVVLHQIGRKEAGPACWLVMRKEVFGRNQPYAQQIQVINNLNAVYEAGPSTVDLVTVVFTRFVVTQERYLGDDTGIEARWTYGRCKETVEYYGEAYQVVVGGHSLVARAPGPVGLDVRHSNSEHVSTAVAALRKFPGKKN